MKLYYDVYCASLIERKRHWLKKFWDVLRRAPASLRVSTDVTPALLEEVARDTDDFSGREIEKLLWPCSRRPTVATGASTRTP